MQYTYNAHHPHIPQSSVLLALNNNAGNESLTIWPKPSISA